MTLKKQFPKKKKIRALIVEGGGMRGIFTAGVLDAFFKAGYDPFDLYMGVSAGACNLASHLAGQYQRNLRIYTNLMSKPEFISFTRFLKGRHWMDLDWLWNMLAQKEPLNTWNISQNLKKNQKEFLIVSTSAYSGMPVYLSAEQHLLNDQLKASCAVPGLYRNFIEIDSEPLTDGGVSDPIPVAEAYRRGARQITVLRSRPLNFVKKNGMESFIASLFVQSHRSLRTAITNHPETYMKAVKFINNPPDDVEIMQIAPPRPMETKRLTRDLNALFSDYQLGESYGTAAIPRL